MAYEVRSTPYFDREYKKLAKIQLALVHAAIDNVIERSDVGELKSGDLSGCRVLKFKVLDRTFLLGYEVIGEIIFLQRIASHENFYCDWKKNR